MIDVDDDVELNWFSANTIAIHERFGVEGAVGELCKGAGGAPLGIIQHFVQIAFEFYATISL